MNNAMRASVSQKGHKNDTVLANLACVRFHPQITLAMSKWCWINLDAIYCHTPANEKLLGVRLNLKLEIIQSTQITTGFSKCVVSKSTVVCTR
jgi:hypothetical protein